MTSMVTVRANHGTPAQRELARDVTRWFADVHLPLHRRIHIIINFKDKMDGLLGSATWNGASSDNATSYTICVRSTGQDEKQMIATLVHELVHVQQMLSRDLQYYESTYGYVTFWRGREAAGISYRSQPWEQEAYARENTLRGDYLKYRRKRQQAV